MTEQTEIIPISPFKRAFDIIAGLIIIVLLLPVMLILLVGIALEQLLSPSARGPLLYHEIRISQGKPFTFYKIRTFKTAALAVAHKNGTIHTKELEQDWHNFTLMGLVLRQVYLDEFPQLFLVLAGKMSLVGPRPANPEEYARSVAGGLHAKKLLKAGLTGRFQTHKASRYELNQEQTDMEYAQFCRSNPGWRVILRDTKTLYETVLTIFRAEGI